ncbi:MAG TPA: hypothetical protein VH720_05820 [Candidatus Limnocylindrales bacterium]
MPEYEIGAQRASRRSNIRGSRSRHLVLIPLIAAFVAVSGLAASATPAQAAGPKVVVVVGPSHSNTAKYIANGRALAAYARSLGASVTEIYSPNATWTRVKAAAQGAKLFIYLGHGNGWPSPYGPFQPYTKDGLGLNASAGHGHANVKYWGEYYVARYINFAPNAVVILNHLCYASGNSEWGSPNPTRASAIKRVDNFGAGFLRANARAVFADGLRSPEYVVYGLLRTDLSMNRIFWSASSAKRTYAFTFASRRTPGMGAILDPYAPNRYYRSVIGRLSTTAAQWRG